MFVAQFYFHDREPWMLKLLDDETLFRVFDERYIIKVWDLPREAVSKWSNNVTHPLLKGQEGEEELNK